MRSVSLFRSAASFTLAFLLATVPVAQAQVVSSGLTGVVRDEQGKGVPAAAITATHLPTGTVYSAVSSSEGRYNFRGMIVGGPYAVVAKVTGFQPLERTVNTVLGSDVEVSFQLKGDAEEVVELDTLVVEGESNELDATATGAGGVLSEARLGAKPSTQRSLADVISVNPQVILRAMSGDREEAQISAVGTNARYNSILIDGARINDQFGLNMTGLASFFNPLSLDTIEQLSVSVSPYDVRQSGFTGATINAVTKSGTNQFHGSAYYMFSGDEWLGIQMQGADVGGNTAGTVPKLERETWGATLGGPIIKNRLFFFGAYEKFTRQQAPGEAGFLPTSAALAAIDARLAQINQTTGHEYEWGVPGGTALNLTDDEKIMAKVDWNVTDSQRLSVRYSKTEGSVPQYGSFTSTSGARGVNSTPTGAGFAYDSHFYFQERAENTIALQLLSQWSSNFKTEIKYAQTSQDQLTPTNSTLPLINILNVPGISQSGNPTTGLVFLGTEFSRHGNQILVDTKSYSATGDYFWRDTVFSFGFDREESDYFNVFRAGSYGQFDFNGTAGFTAGTVAAFNRSMYDPAIRPAADLSAFAVTGLFGQTKWDVSPRLSLVGGLRVDQTESATRPLFNQALFTTTGFRNDGTVDGVTSVSPRLGFNWAMNDDRSLQLRGGVGRFLGRSPWVFFSNSYNQLGVGTFTITTPPSSLESYLTNQFDQENPIGTGTDNPSLRREVDWTDDKIALPSVWRGNLAVDYRMPFLDSTATFEVVQTYNDDAFFIRNENLRSIGTGADGRPRFAGNPGGSNASLAKYPAFLNLYHIVNVNTGNSRYYTLALDRALKDHWAYNFAYTLGSSTEAQIFGSTTAGSQFGRNAVFYQNTIEEGRSDFENEHRIQFTLTREFYFRKNMPTRISLYYEGRSGSPYSWVYASDLNGDGVADNDLIAVPTDASDPRFNFSTLTAAGTLDDYLAYMESSGLSRFAGGYAPKNSFQQPWVNRLDLKMSQTLPAYKDSEVELFLDFTNFGAFISEDIFGYYERTTLVQSDTFWRRTIGTAAYDAAGLIRPGTFAPTGIVFDNPQSRWRVQIGARLKF